VGSLRNPIGPLPSSIYWRRRAVLFTVLGVIALLVLWVLTSGGGGGANNADGKPTGSGPASSIGPGPASSGPAISSQPGGRDESSDAPGGGTGTGTGSGSGSGDGTGSGSGAGSDDGTGGTTVGAGSTAGTEGSTSGIGAGTGTDSRVPAGSALPDCTSGSVTVAVRSSKNSYTPDEKPKLELTFTNASGISCKTDLGPKSTVLTVTLATEDTPAWSTDDCPADPAARLYQVPAHGSTPYTVGWDRTFSSPGCATPPPGSAKPGTYLVEAKAPGLTAATTSFVLAND
jgi:hypothetical protein